EKNLGTNGFKSSMDEPSGTFNSKTIMVMMMASTPSLNASNLPEFIVSNFLVKYKFTKKDCQIHLTIFCSLAEMLIFQIAEFPGIEILKCLQDFFPGIHHKRPVRRNRLVQWFSTQNQNHGFFGCFYREFFAFIFKQNKI